MRLVFFVSLVLAGSASGFQAAFLIDTVAGSSWVGDQGRATSAILRQAEGLAADLSGNVYIADAGGHRVRQITPAGIIRTIAGTGTRGFSGDGRLAAEAQLDSPYGILLDSRGNLFIADLGNSRVRRIGPDGIITTVAGGGNLPAGGANEGSSATLLALNAPRNLAMDSSGNLYISDFSAHKVYRMDGAGVLTTFAGTGQAGFGGDGGAAAGAMLAYPAALAVDKQDNVYIGDTQNHLVRKIARGVMSSYARASAPTGLALDGAGTLHIADPTAGQIVQVPVSGRSTALAVSAHDVAFSTDGNLYASDQTVVRRVSPLGAVTLAAGSGDVARGDQGDARQALLNHPAGVAVDSSGNIYIADRDNNRVRRVSPSGIITTVAGTGDPGDTGDVSPAVLAKLSSPSALSIDTAGVVYVVDTVNARIRKISSDGRMLPVPNGGLQSPVYAIPGPAGELYIADMGLNAILKLDLSGRLTTVLSGLKGPRGLALDPEGNLYFTEMDAGRVSRLAPNGSVARLGSGIWNIPRSVAVAASGDVFVADTGRQQIIRIDGSGRATVVAGTGKPGFSGDGGRASAAQLGFPWDIAASATGALYIADLDNSRIRILTPGPDDIVGGVTLFDAVNAATLAPGPLAPGMLIEVRGTSLGAVQLADTQVLFGSLAGPILFVDQARLLVQVPEQIAPGIVDIDVRHGGVSQGTIPSVNIAESAPALFADASGQAAANNEDGSLNSSSNPAARGSVVSLYGTGFGIGSPSLSVRIGGYETEILYAGRVASTPGLYQINARVPAGYVAPGIVSVTASTGSASTQPSLTLAVR